MGRGVVTVTTALGRPHTYADGLPGHAAAETSIEAARAILARCGPLERRAYDLIAAAGPNGLTDQELEDMAHDSERRTLRPRRVALYRKGLVANSGRHRATEGHRAGIVWVAVTPGGQGKLL